MLSIQNRLQAEELQLIQPFPEPNFSPAVLVPLSVVSRDQASQKAYTCVRTFSHDLTFISFFMLVVNVGALFSASTCKPGNPVAVYRIVCGLNLFLVCTNPMTGE
jgi:hypothetical protein